MIIEVFKKIINHSDNNKNASECEGSKRSDCGVKKLQSRKYEKKKLKKKIKNHSKLHILQQSDRHKQRLESYERWW